MPPLFPTRLRGTLGGCVAVSGALGARFFLFATGALAPLPGGAGPAVAVLGLATLPAAGLLLLSLPETAGLSLEVSALERSSEPEAAARA